MHSQPKGDHVKECDSRQLMAAKNGITWPIS